MDKKRLFMYIQSALYILWAVLMAAAAIRIYSEGAAYQAQGHPEVWIYTREKAAAAIGAYAPLFAAAFLMTVAGLFMGIRDDGQDRPASDPDLMRIYKEERDASRDRENELKKESRLRIARLCLLAAAVIFIIAGIFNGSMQDVLIKAINICTECVGLG